MVSVCDATLGSLAKAHGWHHPDRPRRHPPFGRGRARLPSGARHQRRAGPLPVWAGLLTPQGKCLFDFIVWADGDDLLLDCEAAAADDLIKRLTIYRLRRPISIERDDALGRALVAGRGEGTPDPRLPSSATAGWRRW